MAMKHKPVLDDFRGFVGKSRWRFASTMPQNPHWYVLRSDSNDAEFCAAVLFIRREGQEQVFKGRPYVCYAVDGYSYWTMGNPLERTKLINRCRL